MDDIQDEDFIKYGIFPELHGYAPSSGNNINNNNGYDDDDVVHRPKVVDATFAAPRTRQKSSDFSFTPRQQSRPASNYGYESNQRVGDANSVVLKRLKRDDPDPEELFKKVDAVRGGPIESRPDTQTIIPYKTRMAADILVAACENNEIRLDYNAQSDLKKLVNCDDEYTMVDPPIVIYDTLSTGSCSIYLKEVVRLSIYLLACFFKCTYLVEVVPDVRSNPKQYTEANVKPYHDSNVEHAQPFKCEDAVMAVMRERFSDSDIEEKLTYIKIHMMRIGHQSSFQASDPEFLTDQIAAIGSVLNNEKVSRGERPLMGRDSND